MNHSLLSRKILQRTLEGQLIYYSDQAKERRRAKLSTSVALYVTWDLNKPLIIEMYVLISYQF